MFYKVVRKIAWLVCKITFFFRADSIQKIPETGGAVICANHRSFWDPVFIAGAVKRPLAYIGKQELFKNKLFSWVLRNLHCFPVNRGGGDFAVVKTALRLLRSGEALVIFPEGERIRKGKKPHPKPGALRLAIMAGVPVIPVGIRGEIKPFKKMEIRVGTPIDTSVYKDRKYTEEEYDALIKEIMAKVYSLAGTEHLNV